MKQTAQEPDLTTDLANTPLSSPEEFHRKLRHFLAVRKSEVEQALEENPEPLKRGPKSDSEAGTGANNADA